MTVPFDRPGVQVPQVRVQPAPLPADGVYFGEVSLSGAVRPVAQMPARLKEAAKLGFKRAILPELTRGDGAADAGLTLNAVGSLTELVAEIAAKGKGKREKIA